MANLIDRAVSFYNVKLEISFQIDGNQNVRSPNMALEFTRNRLGSRKAKNNENENDEMSREDEGIAQNIK